MAVPGELWGQLIAEEYCKLNDFYNTDVGFLNELRKRGFNTDLTSGSYKHEHLYRFMNDGKKQMVLIKNYVAGVVNGVY